MELKKSSDYQGYICDLDRTIDQLETKLKGFLEFNERQGVECQIWQANGLKRYYIQLKRTAEAEESNC